MAKKAIRKREATPIIKDYKKWLLKQRGRVLPKSPLGQAINYTLKNWVALTRYRDFPANLRNCLNKNIIAAKIFSVA